jgi:hypothetical protein
MPLRVILDTDPGIDDALAILLALASPEVELAAVSVTGGNCALEDGVRNALGVLALGGRADVPVCAGVALRHRAGLCALAGAQYTPRERTRGGHDHPRDHGCAR